MAMKGQPKSPCVGTVQSLSWVDTPTHVCLNASEQE